MSRNVNLSGFSAEQLKFIIALADPDDHRTQKELAAELDVRPETLSRWKREPGFGEAVWELTYRNLESELGRISSVMRSQALQGDTRSIRLFYEVLGKVGSQKANAICARDHEADAQYIANALTRPLTERQVDELVNQAAEHYGNDMPRASKNHVDIADDVSVSEGVELLVA